MQKGASPYRTSVEYRKMLSIHRKKFSGHHTGNSCLNCRECIFITILSRPFAHHVMSVGHKLGNSDFQGTL